MLGTVKDVRLWLPPLRGAFGIPDRPCAPCLLDGVGAESAPTFDQTPPAGRTESGLTGGCRGNSRETRKNPALCGLQGFIGIDDISTVRFQPTILTADPHAGLAAAKQAAVLLASA